MEVVLWLFLIIPGLIYSVWRLVSRQSVCPACLSSHILPLDSPKAKSALAELKVEDRAFKEKEEYDPFGM